jgi:hypothetical protein
MTPASITTKIAKIAKTLMRFVANLHDLPEACRVADACVGDMQGFGHG